MTNTHCLNMYILYLCGVCIIYSFCVSPPSRPILCSSPSLASAGWSLQTISSRFPSNGLHLDLANGKHQEDSQRARGEREGRYVFPALQVCAMVLPGTASLEDHSSSSAVLPPWSQHSLAIPMLPLFLLPHYDLLLYSTLPTSVQRATLLNALHLHYLSDNYSVFCWNSAVVKSLSVPDSLWPHGLQHIRLLCPPLFPRICSNSCPWSQCCYLTI